MFNAEKPSLDELPSSRQLIRSTLIAAASAIVILLAIVLPAEYGIDPTGAGRVLGLTEMGEIKQELADEAERDELLHGGAGESSSLINEIFGIFVGTAQAQEVEAWRDEISFTLAPGETAEWKMDMDSGQAAEYRMIVEGGRVNFDLHGHGSEQSVTYEKGRGSTGSEGAIIAPFAGGHGWFFRNRDSSEVTITLQLRGEYGAFKEAG